MKKLRIRDEQKGILFIAIIFIVVVVLSCIFTLSIKTDEVQDNMEASPVLRVLFVVEDEDETALFSNVLLYYHSSKKAALVNVPGNTGAIWQTLGRVDRINAIYNELGINSYKKEVEKMLGMQIPFYVVISLKNFLNISDFFGGLRVFISEPVDVVSEKGERWLLPSGAVNLDGDKVSTYLHYKLEEETESDYQERYQNIMSAFMTGLHDKQSYIKNQKYFKYYSECFETNVSEEEKVTLFDAIAQADSESIIRQTITGSIRNVDGQLLLFPLNNGDFIKEAVKQTTNMLSSADGSLTSRVYVLEIQNGTTVQGLARNTSILFQNASYDVLSAVNADSNDYEETVIIDHLGNEEVAKMVGEFIHCTNIRQASAEEEMEYMNADASVDYTIILGKDFDGRYVIPKRK